MGVNKTVTEIYVQYIDTCISYDNYTFVRIKSLMHVSLSLGQLLFTLATFLMQYSNNV